MPIASTAPRMHMPTMRPVLLAAASLALLGVAALELLVVGARVVVDEPRPIAGEVAANEDVRVFKTWKLRFPLSRVTGGYVNVKENVITTGVIAPLGGKSVVSQRCEKYIEYAVNDPTIPDPSLRVKAKGVLPVEMLVGSAVPKVAWISVIWNDDGLGTSLKFPPSTVGAVALMTQ